MRNWLTLLKRKNPHVTSGICEQCSSTSLKRKIATYPVDILPIRFVANSVSRC